jgi:predicted RecB family nuclease
LPVLTWAGQTADLPHIYDRLAFHGAEGAVAGLAERHFDMLVWARSCFRLPVPSLRLKAVGQALGFTKVSEVTSGGDALSLFWQYQATADLALRDQLIAYNHDDVASLSFVAGEMARLERLADVAVAA